MFTFSLLFICLFALYFILVIALSIGFYSLSNVRKELKTIAKALKPTSGVNNEQFW